MTTTLNLNLISDKIFTSDEPLVTKNIKIQNEGEFKALGGLMKTKSVYIYYGTLENYFTDVSNWSDLKKQDDMDDPEEKSMMNLRKRTMKLEIESEVKKKLKIKENLERDGELSLYL